jgi:predicted GTPase
MQRKTAIIMGAAGRDFHNFNVFFRNSKAWNVVAFTTAQILTKHRTYPAKLAGRLYKSGILIHSEPELTDLIKKHRTDYVFLSYSDLSHEEVMHKASTAMAAGANFALLGPKDTMLKSKKPVISVCAVRTGAGKSPTTRKISLLLKSMGYRVVVVRHPMPYGDLEKQAVQRFAKYSDLEKHKCTIEEREEYEPHITNGIVVYAGVDYEKILRKAEKEADVILWDGGNNDFPFYYSDLHVVVLDPHRAGHELRYHPGEVNFRTADVLLINKIDSAKKESVRLIMENIRSTNPRAVVIKARSKVIVYSDVSLKNKKVLVVEDGPTLTHGGMAFGAGTLAAKSLGAKIVDPRKYAVGSIKSVYRNYPHLKNILPAMGYSKKQVKELEATINRAPCDAVIDGSPVNLSMLIKSNKPVIDVTYEIEEIGRPNLADVVRKFAVSHLK